jgi:alcohol dehydrogenase class IV
MQIEYVGVGSFDNIQEILNNINILTVLVVTGKKSFIKSGAKSRIDKILSDKKVCIFNNFSNDPKIEDVERGISFYRDNAPDIIIAIGGGSVLDMAKMIRILPHQKYKDLFDVIKNQKLILEKGVPLIAIPTTSGSGSQATKFSVVYVDGIKYSLAHRFLLPDYVIVDPELSYNLPPRITATSGVDALAQAVESYWSIKSTEKSKKYASKAIKLILKSLKGAVNGNVQDRVEMSRASHMAGKAINITTTTAPHAISYPITTHCGLQHGHAVALTLGSFFEINYNFKEDDLNDPRGSKYLKQIMQDLFKMFNASSSLHCKEKWYTFMDSIGLESIVKANEVTNDCKINIILREVNLLRLNNNPVKANENIIKKILVERISI